MSKRSAGVLPALLFDKRSRVFKGSGVRALGGGALPLVVEFAQTRLGLLVLAVEAREARGVAGGLGLRQLLPERGHALLGRGDLGLDGLRVARRALLLRALPAALRRPGLCRARLLFPRGGRFRRLLGGRLRRRLG